MQRNSVSTKVSSLLPRAAALLLLGMLVLTCGKETSYTETDMATAWAKMSLRVTKGTPGNSPTYASRCFGYLGVTMYESIVNGYPDRRSLAGQLSGLSHLPGPEAGADYAWPLALNAGQAAILRSLYNHTSDANKASIDSLEAEIEGYVRATVDDGTAERSIAYGRQVASMIFEWSKSDGGHRAYLRNFNKEMVHPDRPGGWKPPLYAQSFSHHPLHPEWGTNRPFLPANYRMEPPTCIPYDTVPGSPYHEQFMEVYRTDRQLTQAQKEAALWWGDDPDETFTPPGHSYYLATLLLEQKHLPLIDCAETYARTGMAVADAFINCWKWKFSFFTERPNTFIPQFIDPEWESFWPDPPFPAFPSGHAIQAAAAATVLADLHGDEHVIVDRAHEGRRRDEVREVDFVIRKFSRLSDIATETADSRLYGGIHTPQDNDAGLERGTEIGRNVNALQWTKG
ncbi:vanadium-dependent haloperoxidase [Lewinella sp. JB7]|uniref:vanadium-dependent haloperoxidase n=1 Tax=Lewinella sp. JB7 TaxID=2962887 RepID=UPI0020C98AD9|nr:vanadium-dependent haloperoxidase [Lewinella sp. JB7]MCP9235212.1 vanadium-dependent haloperoxidase [Lewinella sp. JB7]